MADQDNYKTYVRETRSHETSGGSIALIVGGLVVAVGFILWLVFGVERPTVTTPSAPGVESNVTVEPAAPADSTTNVIIDPVPEAADPVAPDVPLVPVEPAEPAAPAPADQ